MERFDAPPEMLPVGEPRGGTFAPTRLTSARPPVGRWMAVAVIFLVAAVAKPWAPPDAQPPQRAAADADVTAGSARGPTPQPTIRPDSAGPLVAAFCLDPGAWRIATIEHWRDQTIRVWRAIEPLADASGPDDSRIPSLPIVSEGVTELGWCAPVVGPERPAGLATVDAWHRTPKGTLAIQTSGTRPTGAGLSFGSMYRPPGSPDTGVWPDGDYVFRYREPAGRERWFAVALELRPRTSTIR